MGEASLCAVTLRWWPVRPSLSCNWMTWSSADPTGPRWGAVGGFGARKGHDQTSVLAMSLAAQGRAEGGLWSEEGRSGEEEEGQREREAVRNCR